MNNKICKRCQKSKPFTEYYSYKYSKDKLRYKCKSCMIEEKTLYTNKYPEKQKIYHKKWISRNKEKINYNRKEKYYKDELFRVSVITRSRIWKIIKNRGWTKAARFAQYIGCAPEILIKHIENKFTNGMSWNNYGKWHIDHIIPLASANNIIELYKLCHYTNLQPLWATDNHKKSSKINNN